MSIKRPLCIEDVWQWLWTERNWIGRILFIFVWPAALFVAIIWDGMEIIDALTRKAK